MEKFKTHYDWLNKALPEGLPVPSSTVLIGPQHNHVKGESRKSRRDGG